MNKKKQLLDPKEIENTIGIKDEPVPIGWISHPFIIVCNKCPVVKNDNLYLGISLINGTTKKLISTEYLNITKITKSPMGNKSITEFARIKRRFGRTIVEQITWKK